MVSGGKEKQIGGKLEGRRYDRLGREIDMEVGKVEIKEIGEEKGRRNG